MTTRTRKDATMDDDRNNYDRIAADLEEITSIVWAAAQVDGHYESPNPARTLTGPALEEATRQMIELRAWVEGLAKTYHNAEAQKKWCDGDFATYSGTGGMP